MKLNPMRDWFRPKTAGYGWTPNTWEGWAAILLFVLACAAAPLLLGAALG